MSLQTAIAGIKAANAALVTMIGARFYKDALPQSVTLPAAKFQIISKPNSTAMGPAIVNYHTRVQVDGYVKSERSGGTTAINVLRDALFTAFFGYSGSIGSQTVKSILLDNEANDIEMLDTGIEMDHVRMDFIVDFI